MMTDKERYVELKKRADSIKSRIDLRNGQRAVYISNLKNKGFNSIGEVEEYIKKAKIEQEKKTEVIKQKAEELIEMAKESGKPVIEDAANAVKKELAKVTKNVLEKLEK